MFFVRNNQIYGYLCALVLKERIDMAHHASAKKRMRQDAKKRLVNRYYKKSTRTAIKNLREMTEKSEAEKFLPKVISMVDRLAKRNSWHQNKAANMKSQLTRFVTSLG
jgi:small subunit ribosomal protein S20